jgi:DNA polymerase-3 subunit chi
MSQADFYILKEAEDEQRFFVACRLTEKAMAQGLKVYIHTASEQSAQDLDDLLWSFKPESFIPHTIVGLEDNMDDEEIPVLIGYEGNASTKGQLLINLCDQVPDVHENFDRIAEIVPNREEAKAISREHWNTYKTLGFELKHHQM